MTTNKCGTQFVFHFSILVCVVPSIKVMTQVVNAMFLTLIALPCQGLDQINLGEIFFIILLLVLKMPWLNKSGMDLTMAVSMW